MTPSEYYAQKVSEIESKHGVRPIAAGRLVVGAIYSLSVTGSGAFECLAVDPSTDPNYTHTVTGKFADGRVLAMPVRGSYYQR